MKNRVTHAALTAAFTITGLCIGYYAQGDALIFCGSFVVLTGALAALLLGD